MNESNEGPAGQRVRKLHRSESEKMIAGVCGGLAEHFETDPTLMRAIMIVLMLCGPGLLLIMVPQRLEPVASGGTSVTWSPA